MVENPQIIFSIGSRIFKNAQPLNEPPPPQNCETGELNIYGYVSIWDPKKRACVCVKKDPDAKNCAEVGPYAPNANIKTLGNCDCECLESAEQDCYDRGWTFNGFNIFDPKGCECDCNQRNAFDDSLYITEEDCPPGKWNSERCFCNCVGTCNEGQTMGPNCICTCDPLVIPPSGCGADSRGKTGIFDNKHCECIYPCQPGLTPYFCTTPNGDRYIGCSDCKENEHLSPCDTKGVRHCCEYGYFYKPNQYGSGGQCVQCTPDNYPSCGGNFNKVNPLTCSCCPENYIWDVENQQCILDCETVYDPENGNYFDQSLCVSPRQITDDCECVCPNGDIWGYDIDSETYTCLSPQDRCPEYDPETGEPIGPLDGNGDPLYIRWDSIDKECQCEKGNTNINDCQPYRYLNTQTCECYCPEGRVETGNFDLGCNCEPNKVENDKRLGDTLDDDIRLRLPCVTCTELLGPFANPDVVVIQGVDVCRCQDGYRQANIIIEDNFDDTIIQPDCVSCEDYTMHGAWTGTECGCAPGYIKVEDPDTAFKPGFKCIPDQNETTPTPFILTPTPPL